jgi:hypothetical protein
MKKLQIVTFLFCIPSIILFSPKSIVRAEDCGQGNRIGCKYYYCTPEGVQWMGRHSCYPMRPDQGILCDCDDCQGPNGDRCQGGAPAGPTNTPAASPTSTLTPTITPTPTTAGIPFMGIKLGKIKDDQPLNIIIDIIRSILRIFGH